MKLASAFVGLLAICGAAVAEPAFELHFSPVENLEKIDVEAIGRARKSIDMAAYVLSDWAIIEALQAAEKRGVKVRIVLDTGQQHAFGRMHSLADNIRIKRSRVYMHMKAYTVDGVTLRAGAANFSASGLKHQDNELILIRDPAAVRQFGERFESLWAAADPLYDHDRAVRQMEPR
jgi:phosphatidylserine/phosphatidylglycerophosphate/cardiolipin synthase-like enzyme